MFKSLLQKYDVINLKHVRLRTVTDSVNRETQQHRFTMKCELPEEHLFAP